MRLIQITAQSPSAKDFILVMLLCSWLVVPRPRSPWQVIEYFSGKGRVSALAAKTGFAVASFDIDRGHIPKPKRKNQKKYKFAKRNTMDINGEVGMASLHLCFQHFFRWYLLGPPSNLHHRSIFVRSLLICLDSSGRRGLQFSWAFRHALGNW